MRRIVQYFKDSYAEMKKVMWPTREEVASNTVVVLVSTIIIALILGLIDLILATIIDFMF